MFIGHFAVGLAVKPQARPVSLGTLFLAAQFLDLLWPTMLLLGLERVVISPGITAFTPLDFTSYPITHSLLAALIWGAVFGGVYAVVRKDVRSAIALGLLVVSHWVLDLIAHRPDLPLYPGDAPRVGLGLWNSIGWTLAVESLLFALGVWIYVRTTRARDRAGIYGFWGLMVFLIIVYMANAFGPPPPSPIAVAWGAQALWLLVAWAYWVDRHRTTRERGSGG